MAPLSTDAVGDPPIPELQRLGEQLAQAREGAGLSLEGLAKTLRVEPRLLRALEQGDHQQLPEGVFIVALARRIAGSLHTNVDDAIDKVRQSRLMDYRPPGRNSASLESRPSQVSRPLQAAPAATRGHRAPRGPAAQGPSMPWRWPLAALIAAGGAAALWLLLPQTPNRKPSSTESRGAASPAPTAVKPPVAKAPVGQQSPEARRTVTSGARTPSPTPAPSASPSPASPDTLRLQAKEPSWIEVRDADGRTVFEGTLSGEKSFPLGRGLEVIAGRPYAVSGAVGAAPATPLGGVDDIRWKRFTPGSLTPAAPPPPVPTP